MRIKLDTIDQLAWDKMSGLLPCTVQHALTGEILMQAYMNADAVKESLATGKTTFYSRSKERLWTKGESSKNYLQLEGIYSDCDNDALLVQALPDGPTCHLGNRSCFAEAPKPLLHELDALIASRKGADASKSYTASLFTKGLKRVAQKVGEEGVEVALAAATADKDELVNESADLLYHLLVALRANELSLDDVLEVLAERRG
ncbi:MULTISPECIES: bifunctional phosphoribosyl-AMP cyclohydrolase/phosphoribosyl-ATP diphosphatase HisIE [Idiomarina]|jgi:phosphoribosyl-ATP pyrophosphohydrolase/phosphoribosyl-AMP cyclohydrolase|uniref:Histidine biosynthesis bifunctional protein HisIE n=1 Tax=Idiomarina abyssalis TaxID=86102 RepID=A0A8I1GC99_9GAMM|nr:MULTISPECIES: bifunctional phosphoribosyl-AMP cyclohydrolase/phosphoribosyl-ATP diphosphatase HisIE [Idiomarina]MAL83274.1 bifunctional phosphoribosyl-AMP cyclohydrolase/phosphoribosyl-ATP diphosphatase [Idiomarina sp.]MAO69406.1 bifunctional phosphoribosyl-AMP cyclohydrolase/phosphoribosyl-ATP diphosphatase [Idiomarina sp.]MBF80523.1 bifunctional phosphoribosyl-AMP cyclohydrolase/phosphoribosyl-ATP diphosphatase [Idiomarina sp.]MBJ7266012.1 bifunctional phosphoribosyl-AMP cyclohydrolase/pho|tara:strand:+ start:4200 stop:4808 length:609 start_codon:yes stop_codon:yes gene_type:complete